jgi:hypothetical protein
LENLPGGIVEFAGDCSLLGHNGANPVFHNAGLVRKVSGTGVAEIGEGGSYAMGLENSGTIEVRTGTLYCGGGGPLDGTLTAAAGATLEFGAGNFTHSGSGSPVITGSGTVQFVSGTLTLHDQIPNLQLTGGTLLLAPDFQGGNGITNLVLAGITLGGDNTLAGTLTWLSGYIQGSLTVLSGGLLEATGSASVGHFLDGTLTNAGLVRLSGGSLLIENNGAISGRLKNLPGGIVEFAGDWSLLGHNSANPVFHNAGLVRKVSGTGASEIGENNSYSISLLNDGVVEAQIGTIFLSQGYQGSPASTLASSFGGRQAGTDYGLITFSTPVTLNSRFAVSLRNRFRPSPGDSFAPLTYPAGSSLNFACINGLDLGGSILLVANVAPTSFSLSTTAYTLTIVPQLSISRSGGGIAIVWPLGFPDWTLTSATNANGSDWVPVAAQCGNQALLPATDHALFFRLMKTIP